MKTTEELAEKMTSNILKSIGQENNPMSVLITMYIEKELKKLEESLKEQK
jgi:hypothetical protein